ncbi:peptidylprolyl isomerase [Ferrimonas marina]|uniref:Peptidyl-prolyl cis-trans isomerase n=1 Tax=Ferrimonas marina TaxID=299255 RepID=A0A1M5YHF5_9GAMM|nr:peptidylprolyl isomerase [Ferrimonas marina]SHI11481.1 peptidyl-prolyl cis-trans isomerase A (cyclophilin A) [Ferrimonas marina]
MTRTFYLALALCLASLGVHANDDIQSDNLFPVVQLETSMGTLLVELDRSRARVTVDNFLRYVVSGHYDNTVFHRVVPGFVVQGGGFGHDYTPLEEGEPIVNESGNGLKNRQGTIAMARANAPHTATNQFYFNLDDNDGLDPGRRWGYAVFGEITEGQEVLEQMGQVPTDYLDAVGADTVPVEPLRLLKATLLPE